MTDHAKRALAGDDPVLVPVFSPRSAGLLIPWLSGRTAPLYVAAISRNVADALASAAPDCLRISATLDGEGMLTALGELIAESSTP